MSGNRLVSSARKLRREQTPAETRLWSALRNRQLDGLKFRRQHPIGRYVADFCCEELAIIIELDGGQHAEQMQKDRERTMVLEDMKYIVLRFWNVDILEAMDGVIQQIRETIETARNTRH